MMTSLLFNKRAPVILSLIITFILTDYVTAGCDLEVYSVTIPEQKDHYIQGDSFKVSCVLRNNGDEKNGEFQIEIFVGNIRRWNSPHSTSYISPGESVTLTFFNVNLYPDEDFPPGNYTVWAKVTYSDDINPATNSCAATPDIIVEAKPPVIDLWIPSVNVITPSSINLVNPG